MKNIKKFVPLLALLLLIFVIAIATYNLNQEQKKSVALVETLPESENVFVRTKITLPEFSLSDLFDENGNFSKKDFKNKYSLICFFASWCTTCKAQHDILMNLKQENIIDIYGVAWRDINENTKEYLKKYGNPFKKTAADNGGLFTKIAAIQAVPETWIIDQNGVVAMRLRGNMQDSAIVEIKNFLEKNK